MTQCDFCPVLTVKGLEDLMTKAKSKFNYPPAQGVEIVLAVDGTEIDDEEFLFSLPDYTALGLLYKGERWSTSGIADSKNTEIQEPMNLLVEQVVKTQVARSTEALVEIQKAVEVMRYPIRDISRILSRMLEVVERMPAEMLTMRLTQTRACYLETPCKNCNGPDKCLNGQPVKLFSPGTRVQFGQEIGVVQSYPVRNNDSGNVMLIIISEITGKSRSINASTVSCVYCCT
jgi:hypothetical protein